MVTFDWISWKGYECVLTRSPSVNNNCNTVSLWTEVDSLRAMGSIQRLPHVPFLWTGCFNIRGAKADEHDAQGVVISLKIEPNDYTENFRIRLTKSVTEVYGMKIFSVWE